VDFSEIIGKNIDLFKNLVNLSQSLGDDELVIQGSGGNTSLKVREYLIIKASGKKLSLAKKENIFVTVDLKNILEHLKKDSQNIENLEISNIFNSELRPSIETLMHAIMPQKFIIHSHPVDVIAHTLSQENISNLKYLLEGIKWDFIPYTRPGVPLAMLIKKSLTKKHSDVLILGNHGLIVGAETAHFAENLHNKVINKLKIFPRVVRNKNLKDLKVNIKNIPNAKLPKNHRVNYLANDRWLFNLSQGNSPFPDHVVFCGGKLVFSNINEIQNIKNINKFKYIIVPYNGVIILERNSNELEKMLLAQVEIYLRLKPNLKVRLLSNHECAELKNWGAEKYRKQLLEDKL